MKKTEKLPNGFYVLRGTFVYVFERLTLDTDWRGQKIVPWTEYRYYDFGDKNVYHVAETGLECLKLLPVNDEAIVTELTSALQERCEHKITECEPFADILRVLLKK